MVWDMETSSFQKHPRLNESSLPIESARVNNEYMFVPFFMLIQHHNSYIYIYIKLHTLYDIYLFRVYVGKYLH